MTTTTEVLATAENHMKKAIGRPSKPECRSPPARGARTAMFISRFRNIQPQATTTGRNTSSARK